MSSRRPDRRFPWLGEDERFVFPPPETSMPGGILCTGGNLSPGMLLSAYSQGVFPWFNDEDPIIWWSPDPRFCVLPAEVHLSDTMRKLLRKRPYELSLDTAFGDVIRRCSSVPRRGQDGTWITADMIEAYVRMHDLGYAHSVEAWKDGVLVGGLYGMGLGAAFFGESMFSLEPDASKCAFLALAWRLRDEGCLLMDSQVHTAHVASLGGRDMARDEYLARLGVALDRPTVKGDWGAAFPGFPESTGWAATVRPAMGQGHPS